MGSIDDLIKHGLPYLLLEISSLSQAETRLKSDRNYSEL